MEVIAKKTPKPPTKLEQKKYVVAFLDILGASEKMKAEKESDAFLQEINKLYSEPIRYIKFNDSADVGKKLKNKLK